MRLSRPAERYVRNSSASWTATSSCARNAFSAFLRFVVEWSLDGEGSSLKEQVLGSELYGKGPEFDGSADHIVRVDARRLRDKLGEYYSEFPRDPILISPPKGSYVPRF